MIFSSFGPQWSYTIRVNSSLTPDTRRFTDQFAMNMNNAYTDYSTLAAMMDRFDSSSSPTPAPNDTAAIAARAAAITALTTPPFLLVQDAVDATIGQSVSQ